MNLQEIYQARYDDILVSLAEKLESFLKTTLEGIERIDRVCARAKSVDRFLEKAHKKLDDGNNKYIEPLSQIQDQIGARIICFYLQDINRIHNEICKYFRPIESKNLVPESEAEFGYFGKHYILFLPDDILIGDEPIAFFELQIKTLFQHAWGEAEHDLTYKPCAKISPSIKRKVAFTAAQAWGADLIFSELHGELAANED